MICMMMILMIMMMLSFIICCWTVTALHISKAMLCKCFHDHNDGDDDDANIVKDKDLPFGPR